MANIQRQHHTIDASGMTIGRLATRAATLLRGKHKPTFAPHIDAGDFVRVTHVDAMRFTGKKFTEKPYYRFSGYPGGITATSLRVRWERDPAGVLRDAILGMLPKTKHRRHVIKRFSVV